MKNKQTCQSLSYNSSMKEFETRKHFTFEISPVWPSSFATHFFVSASYTLADPLVKKEYKQLKFLLNINTFKQNFDKNISNTVDMTNYFPKDVYLQIISFSLGGFTFK